MRSSLFALVLVLFLAAPIPFAAVADDQPTRIRVSDLEKTPILATPLKIRITKFRASFLKLGSGSIEVEAENVGTGFETFSPQRLSLISNDNVQVNIVGSKRSYYKSAPPPYDPRMATGLFDRRIAPGARIKESFSLSGRVHLPMRLYYDEKLLAEIIE